MKLNFKGSSSVYFMAMFSKVFIVFLSIITSAIINRTLGVELKGEYAYINNLTVIGMIIFSFGIGQTYSMYRRKYGEQCLNYFLLLTYIHGILCFSIFVISYILKFDYYIYMTFLLTSFLVIKNNLLYITAVQDVKKRDFNNIIYKII